MDNKNIPLSLYVHLPWCLRKCPYCDFNSHQGFPSQEQYLKALISELELRSSSACGRQIISIYCGGGTPNLLEPDFYNRLLSSITSYYHLTPNCEITLEVNPGHKRIHDFDGYSQAGINRLSIGVQSFHDETLAAIGRDYTSRELHYCLQKVQESPIDNINIDLMFALPGQEHEQAMNDLQQAINQQPQHLSIYELTIEQNTVFYSYPPINLPDEDAKSDLYNALGSKAEYHGYNQYEVSGFAKSGKESQHNLNYWQFGDYIGVGAGAHGKITYTEPFAVQRYSNHKQPAAYMQSQTFTSQQKHLDQKDIFYEWCINSFRLKNGIDINTSCTNTGLSREQLLGYLSHVSSHFKSITDAIQLDEHAYLRQNILLQQLSDQ